MLYIKVYNKNFIYCYCHIIRTTKPNYKLILYKNYSKFFILMVKLNRRLFMMHLRRKNDTSNGFSYRLRRTV